MSKKKREFDDFDIRMLRHAVQMSQDSKDPTTKVGAIVVARSDPSCFVVGINGFPPGSDDSPELFADREYKREHILHAEDNALWNARGRWDFKTYPTTIYVTHPVCGRCALKIKRAGIRRVVHVKQRLHKDWKRSCKKAKRYLKREGVEIVAVPKRMVYDGLMIVVPAK